MQKIVSLFLVFIMMALPMLSASASVASCQHPSSFSMPGSVQGKSESPMYMNECWTTSNVSCDHGACDCDNAQATYSIIVNKQLALLGHQIRIQEPTISALFVSKISESLYRPPITTLTLA